MESLVKLILRLCILIGGKGLIRILKQLRNVGVEKRD